jgi:vesicle-fusing ATPase
MEYIVEKTSGNTQAFTNCVYVKSKSLDYIKINTNLTPSVFNVFKVLEDINLENNQISLNTYHRTWLNLAIGTKVKINSISKGIGKSIDSMTLVIKNLQPKQNKFIEITDLIVEQIKKELDGLPMYNDLQYVGLEGKLNLIPIEIVLENESVNKISKNTEYFCTISSETKIKIISTDNTIGIETSDTKELFKGDFNFIEMGIGGLDKQFETIFRRAFSSRLIPNKVLKNLGINHVKGLMLYGPAGTGKTLIARQIGKILNCEEPKIVNGPSLLSSYIGKSEENVRELFEDAFKDKMGKKLHLIILDEFDSLGRKRGTSGPDSGVADKIVNQFLSMIDGPESLNNILLIGMTNRLDMIDDALLRPGRFEVQIEINLPDEKGRNDILKIHTNKMNKSGYLDSNVNLEEIAKLTQNFTGAELEAIVKNAVSFCISKELDPSNLSTIKDINPIITQNDLLKSTLEIKPQFGTISKEIEIITSVPFELYSVEYNKVYLDIMEKMENLSNGNLMSILIQGDSYIGKTMLASQIAKNSGYNCIKFINSESLINFNFKETQLYELFVQGCKSESFVLVLDSIEKIIEYSKLGNIYNNKILQIIYAILSKIVNPTNKIIILLTSSNKTLMTNLELVNLCTCTYQLMDIANANTLNKHASIYFREKKFNTQKNI